MFVHMYGLFLYFEGRGFRVSVFSISMFWDHHSKIVKNYLSGCRAVIKNFMFEISSILCIFNFFLKWKVCENVFWGSSSGNWIGTCWKHNVRFLVNHIFMCMKVMVVRMTSDTVFSLRFPIVWIEFATLTWKFETRL